MVKQLKEGKDDQDGRGKAEYHICKTATRTWISGRQAANMAKMKILTEDKKGSGKPAKW